MALFYLKPTLLSEIDGMNHVCLFCIVLTPKQVVYLTNPSFPTSTIEEPCLIETPAR